MQLGLHTCIREFYHIHFCFENSNAEHSFCVVFLSKMSFFNSIVSISLPLTKIGCKLSGNFRREHNIVSIPI